MDISTILQSIKETAIATNWTDWVAIFMAIPYLILVARENVWAWFFGIISCLAWAYSAYLYDLYIDAGLQIFYVIISFLGLYQWYYGSKSLGVQAEKDTAITRLSWKEHGLIIVIGSIFALLFGYLFKTYTTAAATYLDAFTTVFSIITTFLVIQKKLENWLYWLVIDSVYIYLYWIRGGYFFALLFAVYIVIVIVGWIEWQKIYTKTKGTKEATF